MAPLRVGIYSKQPMTADAQRIIKEVLSEYPPHAFEFVDMTQTIDNGGAWFATKLLVFGQLPAIIGDSFAPRGMVFTLSLAQLTTKANAVSVLKAALDQFYIPQKVHPSKPGPYGWWTRLDVDAPTAIDIETSGNLDVQLPEEVDIINIAFYQEGKWAYLNKEQWEKAAFPGHSSPDPSYWYEAVRHVVKSFTSPIWHNGKFDIRVIEAKTGYRPCMFFDTMLAHHVLNQAAGDHKLKHLARQYLGAPEWEADLKNYTVGGAFYERIPTDRLIEYNAWDVYWTYELWKFFQPQILADENASAAFMLEMQASDFLLDVEQKGFGFDVVKAQVLSTTMAYDIQDALQDMQKKYSQYLPQSGNPKKPKSPLYNPGSWQQTQKILSALLYRPYTDSTDEKHLLKLRASVLSSQIAGKIIKDFIDELLAYREITKAHSTYVKGALDRQRNGRVHTTFLIHGTSTGRLSSTGPNIQNIPRDKKYRSLYIG